MTLERFSAQTSFSWWIPGRKLEVCTEKNIGILITPTCHPGEGEIILWKYSIKLYKCKFHSNKSMSLLGFWIRSYVDIDSPRNSPSLLWSLFLSSSPEVYCHAVKAASYSKWSDSQQPSNLYAHQLEASTKVTWSGITNQHVLYLGFFWVKDLHQSKTFNVSNLEGRREENLKCRQKI